MVCADPSRRPETLHVSICVTVLDVMTDIAVISVPLLILRQIQVKMSTKLLLSCSLCLSVLMIIVAIIGVSKLDDKKTNAIDGVWAVYWQWVEVCTAVIVACFTVFRTFFVQHTQRNRSPPQRFWSTGFWARMGSNSSGEQEPEHGWPTIPRSIMTGMRSFIDRRGRDEEDAIAPPRIPDNAQYVRRKSVGLDSTQRNSYGFKHGRSAEKQTFGGIV